MGLEKADFSSPRELADLLETIGLRLHAKNRIAGGESNFLWHLAETIRGAGRLAAQFDEAPQLSALFGDGYKAGSLSVSDQQEHFFRLLRDHLAKQE